jgi:hypothetical protein
LEVIKVVKRGVVVVVDDGEGVFIYIYKGLLIEGNIIK